MYTMLLLLYINIKSNEEDFPSFNSSNATQRKACLSLSEGQVGYCDDHNKSYRNVSK